MDIKGEIDSKSVATLKHFLDSLLIPHPIFLFINVFCLITISFSNIFHFMHSVGSYFSEISTNCPQKVSVATDIPQNIKISVFQEVKLQASSCPHFT